MADMFGTGVSGLLSFQRALGTTSHNIANVNTDGYSRQDVDLETRIPGRVGNFFVGNGAQVSSIERLYDQFLTDNIRNTTSIHSRQDKFAQLSSEIDNLLADPQGGISPLLQEFFSSVQEVSDDPTSGTARQQMISTSETLVNRFSTFDARLQLLSNNTEADIANQLDEINQIAASITDINLKLQEGNIPGGLTQQSSDLLDTRDALLEDLATKINIQVINESENNMTVMIGNGQTLVSGTKVSRLTVQPDQADPTRSLVVYEGFFSVNDITNQLNGGELGGLLDFRSNVLNPTRNALGRVAIGLADSFNDQHREGMDLQNNLGGDFFTFRQPDSIPNSLNTGTATVSTTITDVSQLTDKDYSLEFNAASGWTLTSTSGASTTVAVPADPAQPINFDFEGLTVSINPNIVGAVGGPVTGDSFAIRPTLKGAGSIDLAITDPRRIAAAAPIRTESSLNNLGDIQISQGTVTSVLRPIPTASTGSVRLSNAVITDGADPADFIAPVNLTFSEVAPVTVPATFTFNSSSPVVAEVDDGSGNITTQQFDAGDSIPYFDGMVVESAPALWQATLTGAPADGDILTMTTPLTTPLINPQTFTPVTLSFTNTFADAANTGTATVSTTISDASQLTDNDYTLSVDAAGDWTLTPDIGAPITITPPSNNFSFSFEGMTIAISDAAGAVDADSFTIKSLKSDRWISSTSDVIVDGVAIAAGDPIAYSNNMVVGSDPDGWEVTLSGIDPRRGDTLLIEANQGGIGDNRNVLELSRLQTTGLLDNGINDYQESYSEVVGNVGLATHSAIIERDAQLNLLEQAVDSRSQVSGVNLDEEAADLIKYQQAYEAAARIIQTAQTLFGTLLDATR